MAIFGPKREEVAGGWRRLHNEELHNLYISTTVIRVMKLRKMRWAGSIARMGESEMHTILWMEYMKGRDHSEELRVDWKIILEWILGTQNGILWNGFSWLRIGIRCWLLLIR
jgi:hypothetical protein